MSRWIGRYWTYCLIFSMIGSWRVEVRADEPAPVPLKAAPWPATDGLSRSLPIAGAVPAPRPDRFVGLFYFLWHNNRGGQSPGSDGPFDVAKILAANPVAARKPTSPPWGPMGLYHYWSEPLFGYYLSDDRWVIRRHASLLAAAGVDVLIFDATNAQSYPKMYSTLCEVFTDIRESGGQTPAIAFMVNTEAKATARQIYDDLYKPGRFRDLWFQWEGRPLLICDPKEADADVKGFFTLRKAHWPFTMENTRNAWHWEATYPQPYGYTDDPSRPEQVDVAVAQNLRVKDGKVTNMSSGNARGRSFHDGARDTSPGAVDLGGNFAEQWKRAIELDAPFVLVTGWNEWIAGRFSRPGEPLAFVDQYDREYSRDIEPMKGGHGDAYYYQLVANVRKYKGVEPIPPASPPLTISADSGLEAWADVKPTYTDSLSENIHRNHDGAGGTHHANESGRNDLRQAKVARDTKNLDFLVVTNVIHQPPAHWQATWLLIDADQNPQTGWEGFDYIVNREVMPDETAWVERNLGGWKWERVARVPRIGQRGWFHLVIPRTTLGLAEGNGPIKLDFKWADNLPETPNILDFYSQGDVAPEGRFKFRYDAD